MNKIKNKKGFTLAEALVAMLLVAIMAAGVIVALMSTKRAIVAPTNREEMLFAIEEVSSILQSLSATDAPICLVEDTEFGTALEETPNCGQGSTQNCHDVSCKAPNSCQGANDFFVYSVTTPPDNPQENTQDQKYISFMISCEGQTI